MRKITILWTDDEIDLLMPHILFLEEKGYEVITASNGEDAIRIVQERTVDLLFLDENMPGISGLETLNRIKTLNPAIPVVMITKSEEENIMDEAIGSKIDDYLIKPVNPKQILLSIKKNIDTKRLITQKTTSAYQAEFTRISLLINTAHNYSDWVEVYKKLTYWELEIGSGSDPGLMEILKMQKADANNGFSRFIRANYIGWFYERAGEAPLMSQNVFAQKVFPALEKGDRVCVILIDNLRLDQWRSILPLIEESYRLESEELFYSILPTSTQYARNAMFAGLMPLAIEDMFPELWTDETETGSKNLLEDQLLEKQIQRFGLKLKVWYEKINNARAGKKLVENIKDLLNFDLSVVVFNFVDILSHARTEMEMIKELAYDESAYRSLTLSWFQHSHLREFIRELALNRIKLIITTDHGTIRVNNPLKVIGDRETTTNIRYKQGKNLNYNPEEVFEVKKPAEIHLPKSHVSSTYIFAMNYDFFVYPNNYNQFVNYYRNTFQHGGISMEEMLIPVSVLNPM
ncbi:MAG: chemotaxis protein CheY [Bacteroides sp. SM23_62_1]|nr:MAG: chemotaxis protein CheY [Bacteroides sp. SM23_62_1]